MRFFVRGTVNRRSTPPGCSLLSLRLCGRFSYLWLFFAFFAPLRFVVFLGENLYGAAGV